MAIFPLVINGIADDGDEPYIFTPDNSDEVIAFLAASKALGVSGTKSLRLEIGDAPVC